jgi:hypothetical protein
LLYLRLLLLCPIGDAATQVAAKQEHLLLLPISHQSRDQQQHQLRFSYLCACVLHGFLSIGSCTTGIPTPFLLHSFETKTKIKMEA